MEDAIVEKFLSWWSLAKSNSPLSQKSAVCVSTIDENGFPQSRFVDLKEVSVKGFVFCSSYDSAKGQHLNINPKISLTAWWDHVGLQVRVVGTAARIDDQQADLYWSTRNRDAQKVSTLFTQSAPMNENESLSAIFEQQLASEDQLIPRPKSWGGYRVSPISVEFLSFEESRLHHRLKYSKLDGNWDTEQLMP